jgi:hypothetical protein
MILNVLQPSKIEKMDIIDQFLGNVLAQIFLHLPWCRTKDGHRNSLNSLFLYAKNDTDLSLIIDEC